MPVLLGQLKSVRKNLLQISVDAKMIINLVSDMLDLAKIEKGTFTLNQQYFDLGSLLRDTVNSIQPRADLKNIKVHLQLRHTVKDLKFQSFDGRA